MSLTELQRARNPRKMGYSCWTYILDFYFNIRSSSLPQAVSGVRKKGINAGKFLFGQHTYGAISVRTSRDQRNHFSKIITCTDTYQSVLISVESLKP